VPSATGISPAQNPPRAILTPTGTVGLRIDYDDPTRIYYLTDLVRQRRHAGQIEQLMKATAHEDGPGVRIWVEQEPGSHGNYLEQHLKYEILDGFRISMDRPGGKKEARALPVAAAAEQGRVKLVAGPNTQDFLGEVCQFPNDRHDDCVDALTGAHRALGRARNGTYGSWVDRGSFTQDDGLRRIWSNPEWFR
jgi:predicted phage terminase large subunit-like protein